MAWLIWVNVCSTGCTLIANHLREQSRAEQNRTARTDARAHEHTSARTQAGMDKFCCHSRAATQHDRNYIVYIVVYIVWHRQDSNRRDVVCVGGVPTLRLDPGDGLSASAWHPPCRKRIISFLSAFPSHVCPEPVLVN